MLKWRLRKHCFKNEWSTSFRSGGLAFILIFIVTTCFILPHCKYLNARFECNDIVFFIYSHYPLDRNAKISDAKCFTISMYQMISHWDQEGNDCIWRLQCHCIQILHSEIYSATIWFGQQRFSPVSGVELAKEWVAKYLSLFSNPYRTIWILYMGNLQVWSCEYIFCKCFAINYKFYRLDSLLRT